jgi:hypothetical protein
MFPEKFSLKNADLRLLKTSLLACALALLPIAFFEALFGSYSLAANAWIMIPVGFHEIGHLVFGLIAKPMLIASVFLSFLAEPLVFLGGFLFNGIAGISLLWLSLIFFSRIYSGGLAKRFKPAAFSFLFIAYLNLFMLPYTLTHLVHVVGQGLDFTTASAMLGISLQQLLAWLWAFNWIVLALALLLNILFAFGKRQAFL